MSDRNVVASPTIQNIEYALDQNRSRIAPTSWPMMYAISLRLS